MPRGMGSGDSQWCAQKQAAAELKLLDEDAQQVLAMFASNMAEAPKPKPAQAGQLVAGRDITNLASTRPQVLACAAGCVQHAVGRPALEKLSLMHANDGP